MQRHRNGGRPSRLPDPDSLEYRAQKVVLLELVVTPPLAGDHLDYLVERLPIRSHSIEPALALSSGPAWQSATATSAA